MRFKTYCQCQQKLGVVFALIGKSNSEYANDLNSVSVATERTTMWTWKWDWWETSSWLWVDRLAGFGRAWAPCWVSGQSRDLVGHCPLWFCRESWVSHKSMWDISYAMNVCMINVLWACGLGLKAVWSWCRFNELGTEPNIRRHSIRWDRIGAGGHLNGSIRSMACVLHAAWCIRVTLVYLHPVKHLNETTKINTTTETETI